MVVYGYDSTIPVTVDDLIPLTAAVVRGTSRALVVADLPFGSYQVSAETALQTAIRFLKETGAHAVKLEGGPGCCLQVEELVAAGIPVMAHLGLTPQSVNAFGGYRVQGRGEAGEQLHAGRQGAARRPARSRSCWSACPPSWPRGSPAPWRSRRSASAPGPDCDAQVLVWQDMAGLTPQVPKFVKRYADVGAVLGEAGRRSPRTWSSGAFPDAEHSYH